MVNVWQLGFRIVAVVGSIALVALLLGLGVFLLVRRSRRNMPPRS